VTRSIYEKPRLLAALNQLHGGPHWGWEEADFTFKANVRYPLPVRDSKSFTRENWVPPKVSWHVDGGAKMINHYLWSKEQSLVTLVYLKSGGEARGGGTLQKNGSHKHIARKLASAGDKGIIFPKMSYDSCRTSTSDYPIEEALAGPGDVVLQHPFVVHSMSYNHGDTMRIAGRNGVSWLADRDMTKLQAAAADRAPLSCLRFAAASFEKLSPIEKCLAEALAEEANSMVQEKCERELVVNGKPRRTVPTRNAQDLEGTSDDDLS